MSDDITAPERLRAQIAEALAIHAPHCDRCLAESLAECTCSADWLDEEDRQPPVPVCPVCVAHWAYEKTELWPCPTARALGAGEPTTSEESR